MGREFAQEELEEESKGLQLVSGNGTGEAWRVLRGQNRWKMQRGYHRYPRMHPTVVMCDRDRGGWLPARNMISILSASSIRPR